MAFMFVGVAPKAAVKKITTRLFTNKMALFIAKKKVKYIVQNSLPGTFSTESGVSLQNIAQAYIQTVRQLLQLDLRVNNWTAWRCSSIPLQ